MGDGVANWAEGRWGESGLVGGKREKGGTDPREEGGSDVKGRSARKVGRRGAAEVVWGEGGSSGGWVIEIGVGIPAKLGGGWGRHGKMQKGHGEAGCNGEQGISMLA